MQKGRLADIAALRTLAHNNAFEDAGAVPVLSGVPAVILEGFRPGAGETYFSNKHNAFVLWDWNMDSPDVILPSAKPKPDVRAESNLVIDGKPTAVSDALKREMPIDTLLSRLNIKPSEVESFKFRATVDMTVPVYSFKDHGRITFGRSAIDFSPHEV